MELTLEQAKEMMGEYGSLYLSGTQITALPDNLTVGGSLYLSGTQITALPDNLTVGGWLDLSDTQIQNKNVKRLKDGDVALPAEGVGRNHMSSLNFRQQKMSPSPRRAWVEI